MKLSAYKNIHDLKSLNPNEIEVLLTDFRNFILNYLSIHGGYLNESLANVEVVSALNSFRENAVIFYNNNHALYTQILIDSGANTKSFKENFIQHEDKIKILDGSVLENLNTLKHYLASMPYKEVYFYICNHNFSQQEMDVLTHLSKLGYNLTIVYLSYHKQDKLFNFDKNISDLRKTEAYLKFKRDFRESSKKNILNKSLYKGFKQLKNTIRDHISFKKELKNIKMNYIYVENGHNYFDLLEAFQILKEGEGLRFLEANVEYAHGYELAKKRMLDFEFTESFDVKSASVKNDLSKLKEQHFTQLIDKYSTSGLLISSSSKIADTACKTGNKHLVYQLEELVSHIKVYSYKRHIVFLKQDELYRFNQLFDKQKYRNLRLSIVVLDDASFCESYYLKQLSILKQCYFIAPKDSRQFDNLIDKTLNYDNNIVIIYNYMYESNIIDVDDSVSWQFYKQGDGHKIFVSSYDYFNAVYKKLVVQENISILNLCVDQLVDRTLVEVLNNKEVFIIGDEQMVDIIKSILLHYCQVFNISILIKCASCLKCEINKTIEDLL